MNTPPRVIYKGSALRNSWCRWSTFRVKKRNNSTNVRFVGDTGSGKSWSALFFAEECARMLGKKFTEEYLFFSIKDVIDKVSSEEPPPGTIFFIDEQQVAASSKDHQSKRAQAYGFFLSTVRSSRYIIITSLPFSDMELKQIRRFFQVEIETHGANLENNTVKSIPRYNEYSRVKKDKVYRKRLIISFIDPETGMRKSRKLSYWDIPKPSQPLIDIYEMRKAEFKRKLYKKLSKELAEEEGDNKDTPQAAADQSVEQTLTPYQQTILRLLRAGIKTQKEIDAKIIEEGVFKSDKTKVSLNMKWMRKKGVIILK